MTHFVESRPPLDEVAQRIVVAPLKTLIVDDDPVAREMLARMLRKANHLAILASSAEQGLELFERHQPDMVLMDVVLPGIDGCQAMCLMKQARAPRWLPVILVSVRDTHEQVLEGLRAGADDYLSKPVKLDHVLAKVRNTSRSLRLQTQLSHSLGLARAIMDHIAEALLCCDDAGVVQASNKAAERLFGYGSGELRGERVATLLADTVPSNFPGRMAPPHLFGTARRRDGTLFSVQSQQTTVEIEGQVLAVMTLRDVTEQLDEERRLLNDAARLREYKAAREAENALAQELLDRLQRREGPDTKCVQSFTAAATGFSGDVVVAVRSPAGKVFVMLADATGHGLAAAISLVPALSVLHAMVARECALSEIVAELNTKMKELLPTGRFLAGALLCVDEGSRRGEIWVGGVPAVLLIDTEGRVTHRFESTHLAFGIVPSDEDTRAVASFSWETPAQLVLTSDGVLEAEGPYGEHFGEQRLIDALQHAPGSDRLKSVVDALHVHLGGLPSGDDASIAIVRLE